MEITCSPTELFHSKWTSTTIFCQISQRYCPWKWKIRWVNFDVLTDDRRKSSRSSIVFKSLWTNNEIRWTKECTQQSRNRSSYRGKKNQIAMRKGMESFLERSKWRQTPNISITRWNSIDTTHHTIDGNRSFETISNRIPIYFRWWEIVSTNYANDLISRIV